MEQELSSYDYLFLDGHNHIYTFKSHSSAAYEVKFKPSGYLIDNQHFEGFVFEMVIVLTKNPYAPKLPPADALISATIANIVVSFFTIHERVVVYICDDSDSKVDSRRKLFDRWFTRYQKKLYVKQTVSLGIDENGMAYSAELISRLDNPHFIVIYESFKRTISGEK